MTPSSLILQSQRLPDGTILSLTATLSDESGDLTVRGHDVGPSVPQGEYEWRYVVRAAQLDQLVTALGGGEGQAVMDVLADMWVGDAAGRLGTVIRESGIEFGWVGWGG